MSGLEILARRRREKNREQNIKPNMEAVLREELTQQREEIRGRVNSLQNALGLIKDNVGSQFSLMEQFSRRLIQIEGTIERLRAAPNISSSPQSKVLESLEILNSRLSQIEEFLEGMEKNPKISSRIKLNTKIKRVKPFYQSKIYQWKQVAAGGKSVIWSYREGDPNWGRGDVALIYYLGNTWFTNTHINWYLDEALKEKLERQIAVVNNPLRLDPIPLSAKKEVLFEAVNDDVNLHKFEVLCDGIIVDEKVAAEIVTIE